MDWITYAMTLALKALRSLVFGISLYALYKVSQNYKVIFKRCKILKFKYGKRQKKSKNG